MKRIYYLAMMLAVLLAAGCSKDPEEKNYNMLKITSGSNADFTYTFSPNQGYWSPVSETVKYIHLVFGDTDNMTVSGPDIMSILFYDEGARSVTFPSAQGQHINIGITIEGITEYYTAGLATLSVEPITEDIFRGRLTGDFTNISTSETVSLEMNIEIQLVQI
jgi:hypothetical protein